MSSNNVPTPPNLSAAKNLMSHTPREEAETPTIAEPETVEPETSEQEAADSASGENISTVVGNEKSFPSEAVEAAMLRAQEAEHSTEAAIEENDDEEDDIEDATNYGPWGIIKHTGIFTTLTWAVLTGVVTGAAGYFFAPGEYSWILMTVLGFMTGLIAAVDNKTHLIKNRHTLITAILTVPLAVWVAFSLSSWNLLFGIISAGVVMGVFLFLVKRVNFGSGGDIKFAPVPAFALGVINPLITVLWLFYAMVATLIILVVQKKNRTAFGVGMAISLPLAIISIYAIYALVGMPYMS